MLKMDALSDNELRGVTGGAQQNAYRRYKLQEGETLTDVAARFHINEAELIRINGIKSFQLKKLENIKVIMVPINT